MAGAVMAATAGVLALGGPAFADSNDNDGINVLNDNNLSVLPVQLCNNDIAVLGAIVNLASPDVSQCTNAPILEHVGGAPTGHGHHGHHHGHHGHGGYGHHG